MSLLNASELTRRFGGLAAVDGVSFDAREGEILGVIGPNGAGKSTLFSLLGGFVKPSSGIIKLGGKDVTGKRPDQLAAAGIARTFQLMRVFGTMTVAENVMVGAHLRHRGRRAARAKAAEVLRTVEMAEVADIPASTLTAAWRKRLEIARALATEPRVILLDEVLSGLTPTESRAAVEIVSGFRERGITTLMVEHVMEVIMPLCDRVMVLQHGKQIAQGTPQEIANNETVIDAYLGGRRA